MEIINTLLMESDKIFILAARFSGIALAPIFNARNIPVTWKAAFVLFVTYFGWLMGLTANYTSPSQALAFILVLFAEILLGIVLSLTAQFLFGAIQLAGQLIDTQMGFGIMNVVDPMSGAQAPMLGNFKYILAMMVFLQIDGHHLFLQAIYDSYQTIPIGQFGISGSVIQLLLQFFGEVFIIGLKLSLPIVGSLLITDVIMGIMSRTVPQMNIFMVGMPAKIILGFGVLLVTLPLYIYLLNAMFEHLFSQIYQLLRVRL